MNDERPIEKLLRRYAKKRRDEASAPLKLHPATRRLLQGEVSRHFSKGGVDRKNSFAGWFAAFRRRWVYATAALGVLLIAGVVLVTQNRNPRLDAKLHEMDLAKNEVAPTEALGKDGALRERKEDLAKRRTSPPPSAAPAAEMTLNQPAPTSPIPADRYGLKRDLPGSLASSSGTERLRALNDQSAIVSPNSTPSDAGQITLTQQTIAKKAPQTAAPPEEYAFTARASQESSQRLAGKPVLPPASSTVAIDSQSVEIAGARQSARFAVSNAGQNSQLTATRPDTAPAATGSVVAFESRESLATLARDGGLERDKSPAISQSFANQSPVALTAKTLKAAPASPVLANFQIEQTGDRLRVIDSDGSSYLGEINAAYMSAGGGSQSQLQYKSEEKLAVPTVAAAPAFAQQPVQSQSYRVTGTNRTLNQQVVFTWNFVPLTNALIGSKTKSMGVALTQDKGGAQQQFPTLLQNSGISGRAQINAAKEIQINAVPVKR